MSDFLGIPKEKWPIAIVMVALLAFSLTWLQGRFDQSDSKKAIAIAMQWKPNGAQSVLDGLSARGEGDPQCDGKVVSQLLGDVAVRCSTPAKPQIDYEFRVLLDGRKPPRADNDAAQKLVAGLH